MYVGLLSFDIDSSCSCCLSIYNCHLAAWLFHGSLLWVSFIRLFCGSLLQVSCDRSVGLLSYDIYSSIPHAVVACRYTIAIWQYGCFVCELMSLLQKSLLWVSFTSLFFGSLLQVFCECMWVSFDKCSSCSRCQPMQSCHLKAWLLCVCVCVCVLVCVCVCWCV